MSLTAKDRDELARKVGVSEAYLYQCLTGRKAMSAAEAVRVERESAGALRVWQLRREDWHLIWPHLIGAPGAPDVNQTAKAA